MKASKIAILATGGTIAGRAGSAHDNLGYTAAQVGIEEMLPLIAHAEHVELVGEQVAQVDSKDMSFDTWRTLARRCRHWLAQADIQAIVITHGTDTLEETAFFLQGVLDARKPVVLTAAMRPASSLAPDGPQNVADALVVASTAGACGVLAVCAGVVHGALDVAKQGTYRLDAFNSGEAGPVGYVEEGRARLVKPWPQPLGKASADAAFARMDAAVRWPRVEIVMNYAGASGAIVDALLAQGVDGLVVAGTGNGTVHHDLEAALLRARGSGVEVVRSTRCPRGRVLAHDRDVLPDSQGLSPVKARVAMLLRLAR